MESASELLIFGIENPLIDISVTIKDDTLLNKYKLQMAQACLASPEQLPLYPEIWAMEGREVIPGGSCLNTIRGANSMLKESLPGKCAYFGCIGKDEYGSVLENEVKTNGVNGNFHKDDEAPTGTCAVIVKDLERSLCANLGACTKYPITHLRENMDTVKKAKVIYTTAFFITSNNEALIELATYAAEANKPLLFNLSAGFLIEFNTPQVNAALEYADYVFCNEDEAAVFARVNKIEGGDDLKKVAEALQKWPKKNDKRSRIAIITQGKNPSLVAKTEEDGSVKVHEFAVPLIDSSKIVDLNGAGDSFVGGFLSQYAQDKDLATCIAAGNYLAGEVIQRSGASFPEKITFSAN